ncbi:hypothetical protein BGZ80_000074 [Entomortierella chlamydospora]|uniref:OPA3-domain-containing protein n=1 Tax=Entomortierella chlamydospora TaxID=101097 RepID=A0A9P6MTY2_9FUNG|nr:hypothetical protein BGZ79_010853 [Entomortierella chlamydospora]KAG0012272.1 hypothetical protein BGZ80_000074 [Entomortierella chlamydospora]
MSAVKLGFLAIRTISKPIANSIKSYSVKHPKFRDACIGVAQFTHRAEMQLKMKFLGYKVESIRPLNDARAVEIGANFLGEAIIFGVAGSLIILENTRTRMNARDRKNHVDDTLDNLLLVTSELREEIKQLEASSEKKIEDLQKENVVLRKTLNEILDVSLRLRNHTPYSGQEIGIGDATGGFVLQIADEPLVRTFPVDPSPPSSTLHQNDDASNKTTLQSSYDYHHEHHQLGHSQPEEEFILIDQQTSLPSQKVKKGLWGSISVPWFSSGSSESSGSSSSSSSSFSSSA